MMLKFNTGKFNKPRSTSIVIPITRDFYVQMEYKERPVTMEWRRPHDFIVNAIYLCRNISLTVNKVEPYVVNSKYKTYTIQAKYIERPVKTAYTVTKKKEVV